jgi:hypothetical protein
MRKVLCFAGGLGVLLVAALGGLVWWAPGSHRWWSWSRCMMNARRHPAQHGSFLTVADWFLRDLSAKCAKITHCS